MAEVTATAVRDLREKTGAGMLDCKKALVENAGDIEKAIEWLRKKGLSAADKKSSRTAAEGSVSSLVSTDNKVGVLVEINCETDFVAKNDDFKGFAKDLTTVLLTTPNLGTNGQETAGSQAAQLTLKSSGNSVELSAKNLVAKIGENIVFRRFARLEGDANSAVTSYVHGDGKIGVLLEVGFTKPATASAEQLKAFGKDVAMHIAAVNPRFVGPEEVPASVRDNEKRILSEQAAASGKPANVIEKMVEGRLQKFLGDICLLKQPFVKNPDQTVETVQKEVSTALGDTLTVKRFIRMQMGEGIEKKSDDFAAEVAKMAGTKN